MLEIVNGSRAEQLKSLLGILAEAIDKKPGARDLASLSKQYRETLKEIEELEDTKPDELEKLLLKRNKQGIVRPDRSLDN